jgi:PAS domain S-box-containing protein
MEYRKLLSRSLINALRCPLTSPALRDTFRQQVAFENFVRFRAAVISVGFLSLFLLPFLLRRSLHLAPRYLLLASTPLMAMLTSVKKPRTVEQVTWWHRAFFDCICLIAMLVTAYDAALHPHGAKIAAGYLAAVFAVTTLFYISPLRYGLMVASSLAVYVLTASTADNLVGHEWILDSAVMLLFSITIGRLLYTQRCRAFVKQWESDRVNERLRREINDKEQIETMLREAHDRQEVLVREQGMALEEATGNLHRRIAELEETQHALQESEEKYRNLVEQSSEGICILRSGTLRYVNQRFALLVGCDAHSLTGRPFLSLLSGENRSAIAKRLRDARKQIAHAQPCELQLAGLDEKPVDVEVNASTIQFQGCRARLMVVRDMTRQRIVEEELRKAQRLESIGVLAGGIAHEFNNVLTGILGNVTLLQTMETSDPMVMDILHEAERSSLRARELTQQLLTFSAGGAPIREKMSIKRLLLDSAGQATRGTNIRCDFILQQNLWQVEIDQMQIRQVLLNVTLNAVQAMSAGGSVKVQSTNRHITGRDSVPLPEGEYVQISISDSGTGIRKEQLSKVFDPFFTTRPGQSGLGLSTAYSIISRHSGHIALSPRTSGGTRVDIYLPASPETEPVEVAAEPAPLLGNGRILLMDDERMVRMATQKMLERLGFEVVCAENGHAAVTAYATALQVARPFRVVIMDLTVPGGMGGVETLRKLLDIDPEVRAVVSTGYSNSPVMARYDEYGFAGNLPKPYRLDDLVRVLQEVLPEPNSNSS